MREPASGEKDKPSTIVSLNSLERLKRLKTAEG
jgi:hypothetical protein